MSDNFFQSSLLRSVGLGLYRAYARAQVWRSGPRIFVNSVPKAGTHLVTALLDQVPSLQNSRLWLSKRMINRRQKTGVPGSHYEFDADAFRRLVRTVRPGQFLAGHVEYDPRAAQILHEEGVASLFVIRHPLDVLVSKYHYIMGLKRHPKHDHLAGLPGIDERLAYLRDGFEGPPFMMPMADQLETHAGWLNDPQTMTLRFEDLCGDRGGGSDATRDEKMAALMDFCGLGEEGKAMQFRSSTSVTFRKGQKDKWHELLSKEWIETLDQQTVALIRQYGYDL